jgi:membrane-associated protease RseP (regulator of RpoE activity)
LSPEEGGFNSEKLEYGDAIISIKKQGDLDDQYLNLDINSGISLTSILANNTRIKCSIGENLTFKVYNTIKDSYLEKDVTLGPRYNITFDYVYALNGTGFYITYNHSSDIETNIFISKVNGTAINVTGGDTLERYLTTFNLHSINLTSHLGISFIVNIETDGVYVGVQSFSYWMHKNDLAKLFTSNWPDFLFKEILWLFVISFSITIFNMLPLPIFDGDRVIKEIINWGIGEDYKSIKKKKEKFLFKKDDPECDLSEYRVDKINYVKIFLEEKISEQQSGEILLNEDSYELIDKIGDGFKDAVTIRLPDDAKIKENTVFEISYDYMYDDKKKLKNIILNTIRGIILVLIVGNFALSYIKFGFNLFWL